MIRAIIASTIVFGLTGLVATIAHRASASVRHAIWLVGLVTALGVGVLAAVGPVLEVESSFANRLQAAACGLEAADCAATSGDALGVRDDFVRQPAAIPSVADAPPGGLRPQPATAFVAGVPQGGLHLQPFLIAAWALGLAFITLRAITGRIGASRLIERSVHLDPDLRLEIDAAIDVRLSADVDAPFTLGAWRPVIMLPLDAQYWTTERLRIVLVHEAAHVARCDYLAQLVATAACAVYWFNPIAWLAATRLRAEAEHAADDRVLAAGVDGVTYASHLLELARPAGASMSTAMAVGMADSPNRLERRFTAMLDSTRSRGVVPLRLQAAAGSLAMLAAVPFTSLRLVPIAPTAEPITLIAPTPLPVIAPAVLATHAAPVAVVRLAERHQSAAVDTVIDRTIAAAAGESITIDLGSTGGGLTIHGWDQQQVRLHAVLSGTQSQQTQVTLDRTGRGVELRAETERTTGTSRNSNSYELWVPRKFDVRVSSPGGEITIAGVEGSFTGHTGGGEIRLDDVKGTVRLATGGGDVQVTNANLDGSVSTGGGEALITNTTGGVRVSSGSGPVIRTADASARVYGVGGLSARTTRTDGPLIVVDGKVVGGGAISYRKAGGGIQLESVPNGGSFTTGGGEIEIGSVGGPASFTTGGGDVHISNVADDISVATGAGTVEVSLVEGNGAARNVSIASGNGRIVLELPANIDARFDIETDYTERNGPTKIESDFPLAITETEQWDSRNGTPRRKVIGTATTGSGRGLIKIRTVNGDILIRTAKPKS